MEYNDIDIITQRELHDSVVFINLEENYNMNIIENKFTTTSNFYANSENNYL